LSCYLTGCTALATIGFVELVSQLFAKISGIKQSSIEQRVSDFIMPMISIVPIIAVVFASQGYMTALPITFAFNNSILCCGHSYLLLKILESAYPSIFSKARTQMLSIVVYLAMIGFMFGFGKDVLYWPNTFSVVMLIVAFVTPFTYLLWQVALAHDYFKKNFSSHTCEEIHAMCLVCLYLIGNLYRR
jgi:hypothetical protein